MPPERALDAAGRRGFVADLGAPDDGRYDPDGFWPREKIADTGLDLRWTKASASLAWAPQPGFAPARIVLRARAVAAPKDVAIYVNGVFAARRCASGRASPRSRRRSRRLRPASSPRLERARIEIRAATEVPKALGKGDDTRALGVARRPYRVRVGDSDEDSAAFRAGRRRLGFLRR